MKIYLVSIPYILTFIWFILTIIFIPISNKFIKYKSELIKKVFLLKHNYFKRFLIGLFVLILVAFISITLIVRATALTPDVLKFKITL